MKVAIPCRGTVVDYHFGHCKMYAIFSIGENQSVISSEILPAPKGCDCQSGIAALLREKGVNLLLAGSMGEGAFQKLSLQGIKVIRGCSGDITRLLQAYLQGRINDSGSGCTHHHEAGHTCAH